MIEQFRYSGWIQGIRWARISTALKNSAWDLGLRIETESDKFLFWETVYYRIAGPEETVLLFVQLLRQAVKNLNHD